MLRDCVDEVFGHEGKSYEGDEHRMNEGLTLFFLVVDVLWHLSKSS
jgi:hypothetical protein